MTKDYPRVNTLAHNGQIWVPQQELPVFHDNNILKY